MNFQIKNLLEKFYLCQTRVGCDVNEGFIKRFLRLSFVRFLVFLHLSNSRFTLRKVYGVFLMRFSVENFEGFFFPRKIVEIFLLNQYKMKNFFF